MKTEKCPCENCICIVLCRQKSYNKLVISCDLLRKYLYFKEVDDEILISSSIRVNCRVEEFESRIKEVQGFIKSSEWCYNPDNKQITMVVRKRSRYINGVMVFEN